MTDRRTLLTAAGLGLLSAGTGLSLAACSSAPSSGTGSNQSAGASGDSIATKDVPVGSGIVVGAFVVTQPTSGTFEAFSTVCPHQGCPVNLIQGSRIVCPCHGSVFSLADGSRVSGPSPRGLVAAKASVTDGTVMVTVA